ncbi:hypothetical protein J0X19_06060 [Hymenobacter sp. BT186]|uniref:Uncharacterized protein n=1 Tax=Hymenobacter telluris TaxID=2816474 RepID=A0A939EVX5_9BACT|nr:hypothetical protein [Hymenobacter telluris]MBO0357502.1 hypothetical protein [Hymenobacter telluris]MBW3373528.1 hypothetical protein [Hymenobacter norwichensis]
MKIIFLCGSLEPGRDGIGDYVRRLSGELLRAGHYASAISLYDQHVHEAYFGDQLSDSKALSVLRLPSVWKSSKRFARAEQWVNEFNPDCISLQFVPFAFHKKGLPYNMGKHLSSLGRGKKWHIMFHELWVGMDYEAPIKFRILGKAQQFIIKSLINLIQPRVIHTQTHLYQIQLSKLGATAHSLPLFGNIPVENVDSENCNSVTIADTSRSVSLVLFGNIHQSSFVQPFTDEAAAYAQTTGTSLTLVLVGRCGPEAEHWVSAWKAAGLTVEVLGEQSPSYISAILRKATFGLATTPTALIEKSGTAAAMKEHGLRVICAGRPWHPRTKISLKLPDGIVVYTPGNFKDCVALNIAPVSNENTVSFIAERLLSHLTINN